MLMTSSFVCATLNLGRKKSTGTEHSSSRIAQITEFLEFLHEYCKENSETCTKF